MRRVLLASATVLLVARPGMPSPTSSTLAPGLLTRDRPAAAPDAHRVRHPRSRRCSRRRPPRSTRCSPPRARTAPLPTAAGLQSALVRRLGTTPPSRAGSASACATASRVRRSGPSTPTGPACPHRPSSCSRRSPSPTASTSRDTMTTGVVAAAGLDRRRPRRRRGHPPRARAGDTRRRWPAGPGLADLAGAGRRRAPGQRPHDGRPPARPQLRPGPALPLVVEPQRRARRVHPGRRHDRPRHPAAARPVGPRRASPSTRSPRRSSTALAGAGVTRTPAATRDVATHPPPPDAEALGQRGVGDLRRGARPRPRPQRERPHREPRPPGSGRGRAAHDAGRAPTRHTSWSGSTAHGVPTAGLVLTRRERAEPRARRRAPRPCPACCGWPPTGRGRRSCAASSPGCRCPGCRAR